MTVSPVSAQCFNDMNLKTAVNAKTRRREDAVKALARLSLLLAVAVTSWAAELPPPDRQFLDQHCFECHDAEVKKGGLDLTVLKFDPSNLTNFNTWVLVHDRVVSGEMPPQKKARPGAAGLEKFTTGLSASLVAAEQARNVR